MAGTSCGFNSQRPWLDDHLGPPTEVSEGDGRRAPPPGVPLCFSSAIRSGFATWAAYTRLQQMASPGVCVWLMHAPVRARRDAGVCGKHVVGQRTRHGSVHHLAAAGRALGQRRVEVEEAVDDAHEVELRAEHRRVRAVCDHLRHRHGSAGEGMHDAVLPANGVCRCQQLARRLLPEHDLL